MLYAFGFERVAVVVGDLFFVDPNPGPGQEGAERGVRLEVRVVERPELQGSVYSVQPISIDLRKTILGVFDLAEFSHNQGHGREFARGQRTSGRFVYRRYQALDFHH